MKLNVMVLSELMSACFGNLLEEYLNTGACLQDLCCPLFQFINFGVIIVIQNNVLYSLIFFSDSRPAGLVLV